VTGLFSAVDETQSAAAGGAVTRVDAKTADAAASIAGSDLCLIRIYSPFLGRRRNGRLPPFGKKIAAISA
jgi:hypothetical protein